MKYINQLLLLLIVTLISVVSYLGISGAWSALFIAPLIIIVSFIAFYLYKQFKLDEKQREQKSLILAMEDKEAEKWISDTFVPNAIGFGRQNRKALAIYFFMLLICVYFLWHFISYGLEAAIINTIIGAAALALFIFYVFFMSSFSSKIFMILPENIRKYISDDWIRAYIYLLPVGFIAHLAYPLETLMTNLNNKLLSSHLFILIYTFLFLGAYCIIYLYHEIKNDEETKTKKEMKSFPL